MLPASVPQRPILSYWKVKAALQLFNGKFWLLMCFYCFTNLHSFIENSTEILQLFKLTLSLFLLNDWKYGFKETFFVVFSSDCLISLFALEPVDLRDFLCWCWCLRCFLHLSRSLWPLGCLFIKDEDGWKVFISMVFNKLHIRFRDGNKAGVIDIALFSCTLYISY